jgi:hypothetical protein
MFMDTVVSILREKSSKLITDLGALRLDADITGGGISRGAHNLIQAQNQRPAPEQPAFESSQIPDVIQAPPAPPATQFRTEAGVPVAAPTGQITTQQPF